MNANPAPPLDQEKIKSALLTQTLGRTILYFDSIGSTNSEGKARSTDLADGTLLVSEVQTAGRGRMGRSWVSPWAKGLWLSLILKPSIPIHRLPTLTLVVAAAIYQALERTDPLLSEKLRIKWPNDLLAEGKKIGGILTEMQMNGQQLQAIIVGIGLNILMEEADFPPELQGQATSLLLVTGRRQEREGLLAEMLNCFEPLYQAFLYGDLTEVIRICRQSSFVIGRKVTLHRQGEAIERLVLDIGDQGDLIVQTPSGKIEHIISGEITLRTKTENI